MSLTLWPAPWGRNEIPPHSPGRPDPPTGAGPPGRPRDEECRQAGPVVGQRMPLTRTAFTSVAIAALTSLALAGAADAHPAAPNDDDNCAGTGVHVGLCQVLAEQHVLSGNNPQVGSRP
ncbi:hypothetical protein GCM10010331_20910 [Streptomyces xanthochromogenes]|nr:hypothetical protein GCM10010331_20910 [Streptomyces xanthochromogenes]